MFRDYVTPHLRTHNFDSTDVTHRLMRMLSQLQMILEGFLASSHPQISAFGLQHPLKIVYESQQKNSLQSYDCLLKQLVSQNFQAQKLPTLVQVYGTSYRSGTSARKHGIPYLQTSYKRKSHMVLLPLRVRGTGNSSIYALKLRKIKYYNFSKLRYTHTIVIPDFSQCSRVVH